MKTLFSISGAMALFSMVWLTGCPTTSRIPIVEEGRNTNNGKPDEDMTTDMAQDMTTDMAQDMTTDMDQADVCVAEDDITFCANQSIECGPATGMDVCGVERQVDSCGEESTVCAANETCGGGGTPGTCGCTPKSCKGEGVLCGTLFDGCGNTIQCDLFCVDNIAVGTEHSCAIGSGRMKCWGKNSGGQLGTGNKTNSKNPKDVLGITSEAYLASSGGQHSCAVLTTGGVVCWGKNEMGQLGVGTTVDTDEVDLNVPNNIAIMKNVKQVVSGERHTCALVDTDPSDSYAHGFQVQCWGSNEFGNLGKPSLMTGGIGAGTPQLPVGLDEGIKQLAAGTHHTCALNIDGEVLCWGNNKYNQSGGRQVKTAGSVTYVDNWTKSRQDPIRNLAQKINGLDDVVAISAGDSFSCALKSNETVWCWGAMRFKHVAGTCPAGNVDVSNPKKNPERCAVWPTHSGPGVHPLIKQTHSQDIPSYELDDKGAIVAPVISTIVSQLIAVEPIQVLYNDGLGNTSPVLAKKIGAGHEHLCMVTDESDVQKSNVVCLGNNEKGQLGTGTNSSTGYPEALALDNNNQIVRATLPTEPMANDPNREDLLFKNTLVTPLALGHLHTCVHNLDNNLKCWGDNSQGQIGNEDLQRDFSFQPFIVKLASE